VKRYRPVAARVLAAAALCALGCDRKRHPGLEYMPDMARSLPYDSFAPNPNTRDGKTLQPPVAGTVPRGFLPLRYGRSAEDAERAGRELKDPGVAVDAARGRMLYATYCLVCHGERGRGDGPLVPRIPNPPSYASERIRGLPPGRLYHVITYGAGQMPSYAVQVPPDDRWLIVREVQRLARSTEPAP
jgi:mono/diheme cytochrome c family protein